MHLPHDHREALGRAGYATALGYACLTGACLPLLSLVAASRSPTTSGASSIVESPDLWYPGAPATVSALATATVVDFLPTPTDAPADGGPCSGGGGVAWGWVGFRSLKLVAMDVLLPASFQTKSKWSSSMASCHRETMLRDAGELYWEEREVRTTCRVHLASHTTILFLQQSWLQACNHIRHNS
ncbi:unnamed protein product [Urochloa humidicola]